MGRGRRSQWADSIAIADPDEAHVAPTVVTFDKTAVAIAGRHVNRAGVGIGPSSRANQRTGGKTDTDTGAPVRASLGAAAGGGEGARERKGGQYEGGRLGLGHGGLHPFEFGMGCIGAICMGRASRGKGSKRVLPMLSRRGRAMTK